MSAVTTPLDSPGGLPFLPSTQSPAPPPPPDAPTPVGADFVPYLPPVRRADAAPEQPAAFDAKLMVDSTKRKVENPVYGKMPTGSDEGRAAVEAARKKMNRKRARNKLIARAVAISFLGGIAAAGWFGYQAYQDDQDRQAAERAAKAAVGESPGAAGPLGQQAQVIEVMDDLNSGAAPSAGALLEAVEDARAVVGESNDSDVVVPPITFFDVIPLAASAVTEPAGTADGLDLFQIDARLFESSAPEAYAKWTARWTSATQADPTDPAFAVLPDPGSGQISIGMRVEDDVVTRLLIASNNPPIHINR